MVSLRNKRLINRIESSIDGALDQIETARENLSRAESSADPVSVQIAQDNVLNAIMSLTQTTPNFLRLVREIDAEPAS